MKKINMHLDQGVGRVILSGFEPADLQAIQAIQANGIEICVGVDNSTYIPTIFTEQDFGFAEVLRALHASVGAKNIEISITHEQAEFVKTLIEINELPRELVYVFKNGVALLDWALPNHEPFAEVVSPPDIPVTALSRLGDFISGSASLIYNNAVPISIAALSYGAVRVIQSVAEYISNAIENGRQNLSSAATNVSNAFTANFLPVVTTGVGIAVGVAAIYGLRSLVGRIQGFVIQSRQQHSAAREQASISVQPAEQQRSSVTSRFSEVVNYFSTKGQKQEEPVAASQPAAVTFTQPTTVSLTRRRTVPDRAKNVPSPFRNGNEPITLQGILDRSRNAAQSAQARVGPT